MKKIDGAGGKPKTYIMRSRPIGMGAPGAAGKSARAKKVAPTKAKKIR